MKRKKQSREYITRLVMAGLLAAMNVILGKFFQVTPTEYLRFSIGALPVIFAGLVFGPVTGGAVGLVGDLVGCVAAGMAINPIIAVGSAAVGAVAGLFRLEKNMSCEYLRLLSVCLGAHFVGSVIIKSIGMAVYYGTPLSLLAFRVPVALGNSLIEALLLRVILSRREIMSLLPTNISHKSKERQGHVK